MKRETIIRFEPHDGGSWVDADTFVESLKSIIDGLHSVANAIAPGIAQRRAWSSRIVREALTIAVGPVEKGSVTIGLMTGSSHTVPIDAEWIGDVGMRYAALAIRGAADPDNQAADIPASAARSIARGVRLARRANVHVSLRSRRTKGSVPRGWTTDLDLTAFETGLTQYAERRERAERTTTQLVGQVVALVYKPPTMTLDTGNGKLVLSMPARLRRKAQELWGSEVIVVAEAEVDAEGGVRDAKAVHMSPAVVAGEDNADDSLASLREAFSSPEASAYIESLRKDN